MSEFDLFKGRLEEKVSNLESKNLELRDSVKELKKDVVILQRKIMVGSIFILLFLKLLVA
ncbi:MAG: hypothetical protein COB02_18190 [Candidatus Cloacimonadota bacterium]|nr:MAG: hypothetical protein COB02_18190 [Candidatus Cloacimonadota bacterium]